jgi:hypothetical protein
MTTEYPQTKQEWNVYMAKKDAPVVYLTPKQMADISASVGGSVDHVTAALRSGALKKEKVAGQRGWRVADYVYLRWVAEGEPKTRAEARNGPECLF